MSNVLQVLPWIVFVLAIIWVIRPDAVARHRRYVEHQQDLQWPSRGSADQDNPTSGT